jgi:DNA-binding transcriptional MerR regulator
MTELVTTAWAARALGVHPSTISRYVSEGRLQPATKGPGLRGAMFFHQADVIRLASQRKAAA